MKQFQECICNTVLDSQASRNNSDTNLLWLALKLFDQVLDVWKYLIFWSIPIHLERTK